jgi:hypothetical protein
MTWERFQGSPSSRIQSRGNPETPKRILIFPIRILLRQEDPKSTGSSEEMILRGNNPEKRESSEEMILRGDDPQKKRIFR